MAKDKSRSPRTDWQVLHLDKFRSSRQIDDLTSFEFPEAHIKNYPAMYQTCLRLQILYQRLSKRQDAAMVASTDLKSVEKRMKVERRRIAPQLILGLRDLNIASQKLESEHRRIKNVVNWTKMVVSEYRKYRDYEPVFSLYLPYLRLARFVGAAGQISEVFKMRGAIKELLVARDSVLFPLDGIKLGVVFRHVRFKVFENEELQTRLEIKKLEEAKTSLEEGLEEWLAIQRHVEALKGWDKGDLNALWSRVLREAMPESAVEAHVIELKRTIGDAEIMLNDRR